MGYISRAVFKPTKVQVGGLSVKNVSCGETHSLILSLHNQVYSCGSAESGKLGLGGIKSSSIITYPQLITEPKDFKDISKISAGSEHSVALNSKGQVFTWGSGFMGKLGHGGQDNQLIPKKV